MRGEDLVYVMVEAQNMDEAMAKVLVEFPTHKIIGIREAHIDMLLK
jgi:hypothetical protein